MRHLFALIVAFFFASTLSAQVSFGISLNLNSQPAWGPTGYDYAGYYYLPDIEVYYNVSQHRFYYNDRGRWRYSTNLPWRYRNYDLYNSYKVVVNERSPWKNHNSYRDKYSSYKGNRNQQPIRDSRDSKYFANRNHPEYKNWVRQQRNENNNRNARQNGNNGKNRNWDNNQNKDKQNRDKDRK
ncbi:MAG: hypothetical protein WC061_09520 [Melioribacteraceae bacterium]